MGRLSAHHREFSACRKATPTPSSTRASVDDGCEGLQGPNRNAGQSRERGPDDARRHEIAGNARPRPRPPPRCGPLPHPGCLAIPRRGNVPRELQASRLRPRRHDIVAGCPNAAAQGEAPHSLQATQIGAVERADELGGKSITDPLRATGCDNSRHALVNAAAQSSTIATSAALSDNPAEPAADRCVEAIAATVVSIVVMLTWSASSNATEIASPTDGDKKSTGDACRVLGPAFLGLPGCNEASR